MVGYSRLSKRAEHYSDALLFFKTSTPCLLYHRFAKTAAPPNKAPMPTAAVLAGIAGLLVELAAVSVPVAEFFKLLTFALTLDPSPPSSELRLLATLPVAVASTLEMLLAREAASEVMEATSEDTSESSEEILEPREEVKERLWSEVMSEAMEAAAEVAPAIAEVMPSPAEDRSEEAVCRRPPGSADTVLVESVVASKSWACEALEYSGLR